MITITIKNYKGQDFTYTMPDTAKIEMISENIFCGNGEVIKTELHIDVVCAAGIKVDKEDIK